MLYAKISKCKSNSCIDMFSFTLACKHSYEYTVHQNTLIEQSCNIRLKMSGCIIYNFSKFTQTHSMQSMHTYTHTVILSGHTIEIATCCFNLCILNKLLIYVAMFIKCSLPTVHQTFSESVKHVNSYIMINTSTVATYYKKIISF